MKHKVIAVRMDQHRDEVTISALTESPRGTKVLAGQVKTRLTRGDRTHNRGKILEALGELLGTRE